MSARVHVFGAAGFAGAQLAELLDAHPGLELGLITARGDAGKRLVEVAPEYRVERRLEEPDTGSVAAGDLVAVCYPHAEAAALVSDLLERGARVVDVSADHRLRDPALYPAVYGFEHPRPDLLAEAVYGLPERYRDAIAPARLVANPGCFPEASLLALLPLAGRLSEVVIDAKSGVSGAGRTPTDRVHYSHATDNVSPYNVYAHRHAPEIEQELGVEVTFTAHLVPVDRGLLATCYARLADGAEHPDDLARPLSRLLRRPPLRGGGGRSAGHARRAAHQLRPGVRGARPARRAADRLRRHRQPRQGRGRPGPPEPEPDGGPSRDRGPALSLPPVVRDDWIAAPQGLVPVPGGSVTSPAGFRAAGVACGLKPSGALDLGLLRSVAPGASALVDTASALPSAPVRHNRGLDRARIRAVVVNAGTANAATGSPGLDDARAMAARAAARLGLDPGEVAVSSTGTIGDRIDMGMVGPGIDEAAQALSAGGGAGFNRAICTTDRWPKGGAFRLAAERPRGHHRGRGQGRRDDLPEHGDDAGVRDG